MRHFGWFSNNVFTVLGGGVGWNAFMVLVNLSNSASVSIKNRWCLLGLCTVFSGFIIEVEDDLGPLESR